MIECQATFPFREIPQKKTFYQIKDRIFSFVNVILTSNAFPFTPKHTPSFTNTVHFQIHCYSYHTLQSRPNYRRSVRYRYRIVYLSLCITTQNTFINKISIGTVAFINCTNASNKWDIRFILTEIESNTKLDFELRQRINRDLIISYVDVPSIVLTLFGLCFTVVVTLYRTVCCFCISIKGYLLRCVLLVDFSWDFWLYL